MTAQELKDKMREPKVRAILDRINDVEAAITQIQAEATQENALAYRLTLQSLEDRRDVLREELAEITRRAVCMLQ